MMRDDRADFFVLLFFLAVVSSSSRQGVCDLGRRLCPQIQDRSLAWSLTACVGLKGPKDRGQGAASTCSQRAERFKGW